VFAEAQDRQEHGLFELSEDLPHSLRRWLQVFVKQRAIQSVRPDTNQCGDVFARTRRFMETLRLLASVY